MDDDDRGFRVALVAHDLTRPGPDDVLGLLDPLGWGVVQLPDPGYPPHVAAPLLEQVAEQAGEFVRHGYAVVVLGGCAGLDGALAGAGVTDLPAWPAGDQPLAEFLASQVPATERDAHGDPGHGPTAPAG